MRKAEEERKEHEEYLKLKEMFSVDEEGTHEEDMSADVRVLYFGVLLIIKIHVVAYLLSIYHDHC